MSPTERAKFVKIRLIAFLRLKKMNFISNQAFFGQKFPARDINSRMRERRVFSFQLSAAGGMKFNVADSTCRFRANASDRMRRPRGASPSLGLGLGGAPRKEKARSRRVLIPGCASEGFLPSRRRLGRTALAYDRPDPASTSKSAP